MRCNDLKSLVHIWAELFNAKDADGLAQLYTGTTNHQISFQRGYRDKLSFLKMHTLPIE